MLNDTVEVYVGVINRMEPDITLVDRDASLASIAISLKRIADALTNDEPARSAAV